MRFLPFLLLLISVGVHAFPFAVGNLDVAVGGTIIFAEGATPTAGENEKKRYANFALHKFYQGFDKGLQAEARWWDILTGDIITNDRTYVSQRLWPFGRATFPHNWLYPGPIFGVALNLEFNAAAASEGVISKNFCGQSGWNPAFQPAGNADCVTVAVWFEFELFGPEDIAGSGIDIGIASKVTWIRGELTLPNGDTWPFSRQTLDNGMIQGFLPGYSAAVLPYDCNAGPEFACEITTPPAILWPSLGSCQRHGSPQYCPLLEVEVGPVPGGQNIRLQRKLWSNSNWTDISPGAVYLNPNGRITWHGGTNQQGSYVRAAWVDPTDPNDHGQWSVRRSIPANVCSGGPGGQPNGISDH